MATTRVQLPDGNIGEFPASMKPEEIEAVLQKQYPPESAAPGVPKAPLPAGMTESKPNYAGMALKAGEGLKDLAKGVGESAVGLMSTGNEFARKHLPAFLTNSNLGFGAPANLEHVKELATPANQTQAVGKGLSDAAQFFIPGGAEEKAVSMAPKVIRPLARIGAAALGAGSVNKAQGGSFGAGAVAGGIGSGISQGLKMVAPAIAESALNIRKLDRAYKPKGAIGKAILDETKGITPGRVAESAQEKLDELNPQLNAAADRASKRPTPRIAGFLEPPRQEIPLAPSPKPRNPKMRPMTFDAQINPEEPMEPRSGNPMADISEYPGINPHYLSGSEHPELSGRVTPLQNPQQVTTRMGVLLRKPEMSASLPPAIETNPIASLSPARNTLGKAFGTASRQGERTTINQLQPMATHLSETVAGQSIPENITPRQLLDLLRGFGNEFIHRWNPETMTGVKGTAGRVYHAMGEEFNRTVPGARELKGRISNLIPVAKRAESAELNAPTSQRVFNRIAAHTGALAGGIGAGAVGYKEGGLPKALEYGALGLLAPELIASPEGQMTIARTLNSAALPTMTKALTGAGLTATRSRKGGSK